jgi:hypothetical protein
MPAQRSISEEPGRSFAKFAELPNITIVPPNQRVAAKPRNTNATPQEFV